MKNGIVLGGTNDHIELIKQLKKEGFYVILIDYFSAPPAACEADKHLMVSTREIDAIEQIIQTYKPLHIFSACVDSTLNTLAICNEKFGFKTLFTPNQFRIISNKQTMKQWMHEHGLPTGQFCCIHANTLFSEIPLALPLVVKPSEGNSSKGVSIIVNEAEWETALQKAKEQDNDNQMLVEEFIAGKELSVDLLCLNGETHVLMISEIIKPSVNSSTITENRYSIELEKKWENAIQVLATQLSKELELNNQLMLLQCIVTENEISIVEFSLRIGGGNKHQLIKQVKNIDLIQVYIQLMLGHYNRVHALVSALAIQVPYAQIHYLYPTLPGVLQQLNISLPENQKTNSKLFRYKKAGDTLHSTENSSNRVAGILAWGNSPQEIDNTINAIKAGLEIHVITHASHSSE